METSPSDLERGGDGSDDVEKQTDDPFRGPADEPADDRDDEWADERAGVEEADEEKCPVESTVDSERDDNEGTADDERARPSTPGGKVEGRYYKVAAMILVVCGTAIALLSITLGLGLEWWNERLSPPDEDLCTLCGENGLDLFAIDQATPFPTRRPSAPDPVHLLSYSHRERALDGAVG